MVPLPESLFMGTNGEPFFAVLAPVLLTIATGLAGVSWWLLAALLYPFGRMLGVIFGR
jgi:GPI inositol-deacylase